VLTAQKRQPRVQVSPSNMMVAVAVRHTPRTGSKHGRGEGRGGGERGSAAWYYSRHCTAISQLRQLQAFIANPHETFAEETAMRWECMSRQVCVGELLACWWHIGYEPSVHSCCWTGCCHIRCSCVLPLVVSYRTAA